MIFDTKRRLTVGAGIAALVLAAGAGGYWLGQPERSRTAAAA